MKLKNPIIPGFAPDPTIVRFKDTYILVNSSFHVFPGLPIYSSKNLVDWDLRSHALSRPSQLSLSNAFTKFIPLPDGGVPLIITGGLFAPTLRHFDRRFYLVCTNAHEDPDSGAHEFRNFLMSCREDEVFEEGAWSDAVPFEFPGIDPGLFFDEGTGRAYLHGSYRTGPPWAPECSIRQFEIDVETGRALSETRFLWEGAAGKGDAEGPHVYFKDGWYWLVTAEASTFEGHQINVARARDVWGPYEGCPRNPLLTALGKDEDVRWTGHGDFVEDGSGRWFCVHLGIRHDKEDERRHPLGRETFLTPVVWGEGEWPEIAQTKLEMDVDLDDVSDEERHGGYRMAGGRLEDVYIRTPNLEHYRYSKEDDAYSLCAQASTLASSLGTSTFVGRRQRSFSGSAMVTVELKSDGLEGLPLAGLAVYKDSLRHAAIRIDGSEGRVSSVLVAIQDGMPVSVELGSTSVPNGVEAIDLRIQAETSRYRFLWRFESNGNHADWQELGGVDPVLLSGYDMTGTLFGIFGESKSSGKSVADEWVTFRNFKIE
ncbi:murein transglycosylase [Colletotrichum karsti]|uniref:Murein transglycosylase n=1 Tax=Colletotrichum karsti TaxID=1095194 RepID=A0A9P6LLJ4_9PEZI|nr:murein transglycosylase [Colletotrichum karsti]KAF9876647.1 murein transglycosylase [Colletotrichum karsti]